MLMAIDGVLATVTRKSFKGEDTIANRIIHWDYQKDQIDFVKKVAALYDIIMYKF